MKKIISGQSFLYRRNGYSSTVIEIKMKDKVRGDYLQRAYVYALGRFPDLSVKLVEKAASYYYCEDVISMTVQKTNQFRTLGSISTGYHLLDVTYTNNLIRTAFHHGLCDGRGIKPFVETMIYAYCCLRYQKQFSTEGIKTAESPILAEESEEPFGSAPFKVNPAQGLQHSSACFSLPENTLDITDSYRTEIIVDQNELITRIKQENATPSIFTAILFSRAVAQNNPDISTPIQANIAMDLRKIIHKESTHRNCTGTISLPYTALDAAKSIKELANEYRQLMKAQKTEDNVKNSLNKQIQMFQKLDACKTLEEKRKMLDFFNTLSNDTYVISYLGQMQFNDFAQYIDHASFYSERNRGIIINMLAAGDHFCFSILQNFPDDRYIQSFLKQLDDEDITYQVNQIGRFSTGKDQGYITASRQSERYR